MVAHFLCKNEDYYLSKKKKFKILDPHLQILHFYVYERMQFLHGMIINLGYSKT